MSATRILIADPSPVTRTWLRTALPPRTGEIVEVGAGWEILWHLAEDDVNLVVTMARLGDADGHQVLAMARTAGVQVPFVVVSPVPRHALRKAIKRAGNAGLVESWPDAAALRDEVQRVLGRRPLERSRGPTTRLLDAARALALRTLAQPG